MVFSRDGLLDPKKKIVHSYDEIAKLTRACRDLGSRIVCTIGSWDMLHIGHVRYLVQASTFGDVLIVGVDSDVSVKKYKGPDRPVIPQEERVEMLSYIWCINIVTLITDVDEDGRWRYGLLKKTRPDVFVAVEDSYPEEQRRDIRRYVGNLIVLPRQAEKTSSTNIMQKLIKGEMLKELKRRQAKGEKGVA